FASAPEYDPDIDVDGETICRRRDCSVKIGPSGFSSREWLDSTLIHERQHIEDYGSWLFHGSAAMGEVKAYQAELNAVSQTGISPAEIEVIQGRMQNYR